MNWLIILGLASVIFFNRYFFLEPSISFKVPDFLARMLNYAAPSLLTAICVPIIFFDDQQALKDMAHNTYIYAAVFSIMVSLYVRHVLLSLVLSLIFFYFLNFLFLRFL